MSIELGSRPEPLCEERSELHSPLQFTEDSLAAWFGVDRWREVAVDSVRGIHLAVEVSGQALETGQTAQDLAHLLADPRALLARRGVPDRHVGHPLAALLGTEITWEFPDPATTLASLASGLLDVWARGLSDDELTRALWLGAQGLALALGPTRLGLAALELTAAERWVLWLSQLTFGLAHARLGQQKDAPLRDYAAPFARLISRYVFDDRTVPQALALEEPEPSNVTEQIVRELMRTAAGGDPPTRLPPPLVIARSPASVDQIYIPSPTVVDMSPSAAILVLNAGPNAIVVSPAPQGEGTQVPPWAALVVHWDAEIGSTLYARVAKVTHSEQSITLNPRVGAEPTSPWPDLAPPERMANTPTCESHRFFFGDREDLVRDIGRFGAGFIRRHVDGPLNVWEADPWRSVSESAFGRNRGGYALGLDEIGGDANVEKTRRRDRSFPAG